MVIEMVQEAGRTSAALGVMVALAGVASLEAQEGASFGFDLWPVRGAYERLGGPPHGGHANVSPALIDPTFTHHAILEDELRVNYSRFTRSSSFLSSEATVEMAYAVSDAFGVELFIPYVLGDATIGSGDREVREIAVQPFKWSFVRRYDLIVTAAAQVVVPLKDEPGSNERIWKYEPHLFVDAALGRLAVQANVAIGFASDGEREFELATSIARMFYWNATAALGPLVEFLGHFPIGAAPGEPRETFLAPGLKLQIGGWYYGVSYLTPLRNGSTVPSQLALSAGYHVSFVAPENVN